MLHLKTNSWRRGFFFLAVFILILPSAFSQETLAAKEVKEALDNFNKENYDLAVPIFKKYADGKGLDEFMSLSVTMYLNIYYLINNKSDSLEVLRVNVSIDMYFMNNQIEKSEPAKREAEIAFLFVAARINGTTGNFEKEVENLLALKIYYENHNEKNDQHFIQVLNELEQAYSELGNYEKALEISLQVVALGKEVLGERHPDYLAVLYNLGLVYLNLGEYQQSLDINQRVAVLRKEVLGDRHPDYLTSLNNLATSYSYLGNYEKALEINLLVAEKEKEIIGEKHPFYLTSLSNLAQCYSNMGNYSKALEINLKVVITRKEVLGERHLDYLMSLSNLAQAYSNMGNYSKALEIDLQVISLRKEVFGERHLDYLMSLNNLGTDYAQLGNYSKALEIDLQVVSLRKEVLGEHHPDYLMSLNNLAQNYSNIGDNIKALEVALQVVSIGKKAIGEQHPIYLTYLNNLAHCYFELGNYSNTLELYLQIVSQRKMVLGELHPDYIMSLNNLSVAYSNIGDNKKALEVALLVVSLGKEVLGERHPIYLAYLNNLANCYSELGNYSMALEIDLQDVATGIEVLGEKNRDYFKSLNNLAQDYSNIRNYTKALEINMMVVSIRKEVLGILHPDYLTSLNNLAQSYSNHGNYEKSIELYSQVIEKMRNILGDGYPNYLTSLRNLSTDEYRLLKYIDAARHYSEWLHLAKATVSRYFTVMTEHQRYNFWEKYRWGFEYTPMFLNSSTKASADSLTGEIYDVALFTKGLLLNTTRDFGELLAEKGSPEAIAKFEELKNLQLQIQRLEEKPIAERLMNVDSLQTIAQQKETELVKLSQEYGDYTRNLNITWQEVQSKLQDKEVAIEFVAYPTLTDTVRYAALVVRKGWSTPRMIPLFTKDQMDEFLSQDKDKIYSSGYVGKQIRKLCWDPLKEVIAEGETVYFSASGLLHQLAIEHLMVNETQTLGDLYQMHRLSTTKELVVTKPRANTHSGVLYGGLRYDLPTSEMVIESKKYKTENNAYYAMRGYRSDSTLRKGWGFLEATLPEVEKIGLLMKEQKYSHTLYTGNLGNEESFKALSGKQEGIIHIATHGFFLPVEESRKNKFMLQRMGETPTYNAKADPMMRAGLLFAGGNKAWLGDTIPPGIEDGVLTAKEISHLDLRGTDMVVLSACETGLGDVSSEGVFGLQRAFKQAGVQTLVMSLWEVDDKATQLMMTSFYKNLMLGESKREAFLKAQKKCRETYSDPRYWAAFILLD